MKKIYLDNVWSLAEDKIMYVCLVSRQQTGVKRRAEKIIKVNKKNPSYLFISGNK